MVGVAAADEGEEEADDGLGAETETGFSFSFLFKLLNAGTEITTAATADNPIARVLNSESDLAAEAATGWAKVMLLSILMNKSEAGSARSNSFLCESMKSFSLSFCMVHHFSVIQISQLFTTTVVLRLRSSFGDVEHLSDFLVRVGF